VEIRTERVEDENAIARVNRLAFGHGAEGRLVDALREGGYVRLSLVAVVEGEIVGHVLFSDLRIRTRRAEIAALALAPRAVTPHRQRQGVGTTLVREGLRACADLGHRIVIVLGHPGYYPRFGFSAELAENLESEYSGEAFMALELAPGALDGVAGEVEYPPPFQRM
jgi:putative acetyltransferase